jgi:xylulokinase
MRPNGTSGAFFFHLVMGVLRGFHSGMITIGIDCGTQSTKVTAIDIETGEVLATGGGSYGFVGGLPAGAMEQDPAWWVSAAGEGLDAVFHALGARKEEVRALGVSGQQHGLVCVDAGGAVIRPAKLWCDTSTTSQCEAITEALGGKAEVIALLGNTMRPGYTAPKIRWLVENEPANWDRTASVLLPHDFLNFWLTGEKRMEYGDASGTALMDVRSREWSQRACEAVAPGLVDRLPPPGSSLDACGTLRNDLCKRWGLARPPVVSAGGGDNMMSAIGTGNVRVGATTASLGTSGTLFAYATEPVIDPHGEVAAFCDSTDHWLPLVCTMNLTLVTEHVRNLFGWSHEEMDAAVASVPPGAGGLVMLPYLTGERTPDIPDARGVLAGISMDNFTPAGLARAAMESVTLGLAHGLERLHSLGVQSEEIRLTGGGSRSPVWRQVCADVFGIPAAPLSDHAGAPLGAAVQAAFTFLLSEKTPVSWEDLTARLVDPEASTACDPNPAANATYLEMLAQTRALRKSGATLATREQTRA